MYSSCREYSFTLHEQRLARRNTARPGRPPVVVAVIIERNGFVGRRRIVVRRHRRRRRNVILLLIKVDVVAVDRLDMNFKRVVRRFVIYSVRLHI